MNITQDTLANAIISARKRKGYTQEDLAAITSLTVRTIQRIESGDTFPRAYTLQTLATALDIPFADIQKYGQTNKKEAITDIEPADEFHVQQIILLSTFSFLFVPVIHFLIPAFVLQKNKARLTSPAIRKAQQLIRQQVYWVAGVHLSLFITFLYNYFRVIITHQRQGLIHYLVPVAVMYLLNAFLLTRQLHILHRQKPDNQ